MITKRNTIICDECGKFCRSFDEYTPFGCSSYDSPEPLDPSHICKNCFPKVKEEWIKKFRSGQRDGDWCKSRAEEEAAEEFGLKWIDGGGVGEYGKKSWKSYCYVEDSLSRVL